MVVFDSPTKLRVHNKKLWTCTHFVPYTSKNPLTDSVLIFIKNSNNMKWNSRYIIEFDQKNHILTSCFHPLTDAKISLMFSYSASLTSHKWSIASFVLFWFLVNLLNSCTYFSILAKYCPWAKNDSLVFVNSRTFWFMAWS